MSPRYDVFLSHSSADKPAIVAGDQSGRVHFFDFVEPE